MKVASVRELKNQMSKFLKQAQKEDVIVTSRGKPIALISGLGSDDLEDYALVSDEELKSRLESGIKAADEGKLISIENLIAKAEAELEAQNAAVCRKRIRARK
jgi:prevent-host-death family protein